MKRIHSIILTLLYSSALTISSNSVLAGSESKLEYGTNEVEMSLGTVFLVPDYNESDQLVHKLSMINASTGEEQVLFSDGYYHALLAVSPDKDLVVFTVEAADKQFLLHTKRPDATERFVALLNIVSGVQRRVATLTAWDDVEAAFTDDGNFIVVQGQFSSGIESQLGIYSFSKNEFSLLTANNTNVREFIVTPKNEVLFDGDSRANGVFQSGVFKVGLSPQTIELIEGNVAIQPGSLRWNDETGNYEYDTVQVPDPQMTVTYFDDKQNWMLRNNLDRTSEILYSQKSLLSFSPTEKVEWIKTEGDVGWFILSDETNASGDRVMKLSSSGASNSIYTPNAKIAKIAKAPNSDSFIVIEQPLDIEERKMASNAPSDWGQKLTVVSPQSTSLVINIDWYRVHTIAWSSDQASAYLSVDDGIYSLDLKSGSLVEILPNVSAMQLAASENGMLFFTSANVRNEQGTLSRGLFALDTQGVVTEVDLSASGAQNLSAREGTLTYEIPGQSGFVQKKWNY